MASDLKNDIESGTSLTKGVQVFESTRARRMFHVSEQGGTSRENLDDAAVIFISSHNTTGDNIPVHPDYEGFNDLPLAIVHVSPWGTGTSGVGAYQRTRASTPRFPAFQNAYERWFRAGSRTIRTFPNETFNYTKDGTDFGSDWATTYTPIGRGYRRNEITVTTLLDQHPGPQILNTFGAEDMSEIYMSVNAEPMTINGFDRPRGTLRLDAINVSPINTPGRVKFEVQYVFLEDPRTWFLRLLEVQHAVCDDVTPAPTSDQGCSSTSSVMILYRETLVDQVYTTPSGLVTYTPNYPIVDFEGLFPVHDQADGYRSPGQNTVISSGGVFPLLF